MKMEYEGRGDFVLVCCLEFFSYYLDSERLLQGGGHSDTAA